MLSRTNYGEADRIITLLTPEQGKLRLMARGVRRAKSKLAGGIELFSVSDLTFIKGKGEIGTLISARMLKHYGHIVEDIERVQLGYDLIKLLNKATEDQPEPEYFTLLEQSFHALDDKAIETNLVRLWFESQLLRQSGHMPNLLTDSLGEDLRSDQTYNFDFEDMMFTPYADGNFSSAHIKVLRLLFSKNSPQVLTKVQGIDTALSDLQLVVRTMLTSYIRV